MMDAKPASCHPIWLDALKDPATYPHPVNNIQIVETHISWVVLTGKWAYKFKKPVQFGFVDFSSLELRKAACQDELRLNRRTAAELYDGVVALTAEASGPRFEGTGKVLDYAVRIRQFPLKDTLDEVIARHELTGEVIDSLAREVAALHQRAAVASIDSPFGTAETIRNYVEECLKELVGVSELEIRAGVDQLKSWTGIQWNQLKTSFVQRREQRRIRECHGDLHLGNLVLYSGRPMLFDCLEFNPDLRWIDVISDVAFLVMDLHERNASGLAWRALNEWLQQTGDYSGLATLSYYLVYRSLVRAKVAQLRSQQPELSPSEVEKNQQTRNRYVELGITMTRLTQPAILLMHGTSGSGKSCVAHQLASSLGMIQIRSDVERKRLFGAWPSFDAVPAIRAGMYSVGANELVYRHLTMLTRQIVTANYTAIVDAAFLRSEDRRSFISVARDLNVPIVIVSCRAEESVLRERLVQRRTANQDVSDADESILAKQLETWEPFDDLQKRCVVMINTATIGIESIVQPIQKLLSNSAFAAN